ncbi:phage tail protein [Gilvimarinus agarilyticus]|uniref:phage tail protein n=1 Tax=Gilvimarinus agarilyticus TaxID=679259 RepID=UPI0005A28044|nr:tail fiber protein [Gilvimarinus agarilyticus]
MSESFIGEIRPFAGNFAPRGWHFCNGDLLPISEYDTLFSLIGATFGGDGRTTFALPDLRGRVAMGEGQANGLTARRIGAKFGSETETLTVNQLPSHKHNFVATTATASIDVPNGTLFAATGDDDIYLDAESASGMPERMTANTVGSAGGSRSHNNIMPSLATNYIISLFGIYPSRS